MGGPLISIVLPVYRQAGHIRGVVEAYEAALSSVPYPHESILVVNGWGDASLDVCRALAEQYQTVRTIYSEPPGWGRAVKLGLREARGDVLCYTNSARTAASDLRRLLLSATANPKRVVKARRLGRESLKRKLGSQLYNLECRLLFNLPTRDINATPKIFGRDVYDAMTLKEDGDLIDLEFCLRCRQLGREILEVPIETPTRHGGASTTNYRSAMRLYRGAFEMWRAMRMKREA